MLMFDDKKLRIHRLAVGVLRTNCFIVETPACAFVVDPGGEELRLVDYLKGRGIRPAFSLATHAHFDHVGAADALIKAGLSERLYINEADDAEFKRANTFSLLLAKKKLELPERISFFDDALRSTLAGVGLALKTLPGHTKGSTILYSSDRKLLFSGDTILNNLLTQANPFFEDKAQLKAAYDQIEAEFMPETIVCPGHGKVSWLKTELKFNPKILNVRAVASGDAKS